MTLIRTVIVAADPLTSILAESGRFAVVASFAEPAEWLRQRPECDVLLIDPRHVVAAMRAYVPAPSGPTLSPRERETLSYIARGFTHSQTATRMQVSKTTVDTYIARIRGKLGLGNKAELALAALRIGR